MNENIKPARILVEINPRTEEGKAEIGITLDGQVNTLLNGLVALNTKLFEDTFKAIGKDAGMALYAAVQMDVLKRLGVDPEEELRKRAARTLTALASIFGDDDEDEEEAV